MITFNVSGSHVFLGDVDNKNMYETLPFGTYDVEYDGQNDRFYLTSREAFKQSKMYGNAHELAKKTWNTYNHTDKSVGSVFVGDKGSGKTELAKEICRLSYLPVVIISRSFDSAKLTSFLSKLTDCVIFFDEFGKFYRKDDGQYNSQASFLPFFDGTTQHKYMTIVTENDKQLLNQFLFFRPGRFRYVRTYLKLPLDVVHEYMADMKCDPKFIEDVVAYYGNVNIFSFDILQAIVDENRIYGYGIDEMVLDLNIQQQFYYIIDLKSVTKNGEVVEVSPLNRRLNEKPEVYNIYDKEEEHCLASFSTLSVVSRTESTIVFISKCREYLITCNLSKFTMS